MAITKATGGQVVTVQGPQFTYVGSFKASDITADFANRDPDPGDEALLWIEERFAAIGVSLLGLSPTQELHGKNAMWWYLVLHYLESSQAGKNCGDGCKTEADKENSINWAKDRICHHLTKAGLTDPSICEYKNDINLLNAWSASYTASCSSN